jgi:hypothetical protein
MIITPASHSRCSGLEDIAIVCKPLDNYCVVKNFAYIPVKCQSETFIKYHSSIQYQALVSPTLKGMKYDEVCTNKTSVCLEKLVVALYGETMLNPVTQFPQELQDKLRLPSSHYRDLMGAAIFFYYRWDSM